MKRLSRSRGGSPERRAVILLLAALCTLVAAASPDGAAGPVQEGSDERPGGIVWAGVRSSRYGIKPFPSPAGWQKAILAMAGCFEGSMPCAVWIVGEHRSPKSVRLCFPGDGRPRAFIEFEAVDAAEEYLRFFDGAGIRVFLQVEPAHADVEDLIDLVLDRYGHHPCVVGFGVDVEWFRDSEKPGFGVEVDDATAQAWEARVKSHDPGYRLFLKHWNIRWMPAGYRGDIIFVDDSQIFKSREEMIREFTAGWAAAFYPNPVIFQIGYKSDKPWWENLREPPKSIGEAVREGVRQEMGIIWVDFTLRDVLPVE